MILKIHLIKVKLKKRLEEDLAATVNITDNTSMCLPGSKKTTQLLIDNPGEIMTIKVLQESEETQQKQHALY